LLTPWARMHRENPSAARCAVAADGFGLASVAAGLVEPQAANAIAQDVSRSAITAAGKTGRDLVLLVTIAPAGGPNRRTRTPPTPDQPRQGRKQRACRPLYRLGGNTHVTALRV
jgi:hypothetical protein